MIHVWVLLAMRELLHAMQLRDHIWSNVDSISTNACTFQLYIYNHYVLEAVNMLHIRKNLFNILSRRYKEVLR
jgi:hypothetical protein